MGIYDILDRDVLEAYMSKTKRSRELYEEAVRHTPGGVHSSLRYYPPYPFYVKRAGGSKIWDVDGNEYIDYVMGYGANLAGHAHPKLVEAIKEQVEDGTLYTMPYELQIRLVKELKRRYPSMAGFRLSNTGSEAVMHAIKLARAYTGREKIVKVEGSYHGTYDSVSVSIASKPDIWGSDKEPKRVLEIGVPRYYRKDTLIVQYNDLENLEYTFKKYEGEIAAMIMEPVAMNSVGLIMPEEGYLEGVRKLTQEYNVLLIFDEVKTGLRIAPGGAVEYFGVEPDIVTLAKALGGGVPISAYGFKKELIEIMYPKGRHTHSGTYNGNPISIAASYKNLREILTENAYYQLHIRGGELAKGISDVITDLKLPLCVSSLESVGTIHFMPWKPKNYREVVLNYNYKAYANHWMKMLLKGVIIRGVIEGEPWFLSLAHTMEDIQRTIEVSEEVFKNLRYH